MVEQLNKLSKEDLKLFKVWLKNIATCGMTGKETEEIEKIIDENKEVDELVYALEIAIRNMKEEMKKQGLEKGIEKGRLEGRMEGRMVFCKLTEGEKIAKIEVAKKLLAIGMDVKQISEVTGFTKEEVRGLGC